MGENELNQINEELEQIKKQKEYFLTQTDNLAIMGEYLILLANLDGLKIKEETKQLIKDFFKQFNTPLNQVNFFIYLEYGKSLGCLNLMNGIDIFFEGMKTNPFNILKHFDNAYNHYYMNPEELVSNKEFKLYYNTLCHFFKSQKVKKPFEILQLFEQLSKESFNAYQNYLEYLLQISFQINLEDKNLISRICILLTKKKNFSSPIDDQIKILQKKKKDLEDKKEKEEQKQKRERKIIHKINEFIQKNPNHFISLSPKEKKLLASFEMALSLILQHNEQIITNCEQEIQALKKEINDEYLIMFLDLNYPAPKEPLLSQIKESINLEELKKIIRSLNKKEYSFLNPNHPVFLPILQNTQETTLKEISKEIEEKRLAINYVSTYPQLLYTSIWKQYQENKERILQNNMQPQFFQNSNVLLLDPNIVQQIISLTKLYHCDQLPFYGLEYFDQVDSFIEKRFDLIEGTEQLNKDSEKKVQELLNHNIPIFITDIEKEPEIVWMDEQFKKDTLHYLMNGIVISRLKVLRYFKSLNQISQNREKNLELAIFYNTNLFEFEKRQILELLPNAPTRKKTTHT